MNKVALSATAAVAIAAAGVGGYAYAEHTARTGFAASLDRTLPPGSKLTYSSADFSLFSSKAMLHGVAYSAQDGSTVTADTLSLSADVGGGPADITATHVAATSGKLSATASGLSVRGLALPSPQQLREPAQSILQETVFDSLTVKDAALKTSGVEASAATVGLLDYGRGRPGTVDLSGVKIAEGTGARSHSASVGKLVAKGVDIAGLLAAGAGRQPAPELKGEQSVVLQDAWFNAGTSRLASVVSLSQTSAETQPGTFHGKLAARELKVSAPPGGTNLLGMLGYDNPGFAIDAESGYTVAGGILDISKLSVAAPAVGELDFSIRLEGMPAGTPSMEDPRAAMARFARVSLASASLSYSDAGLVPRAMQYAAGRAHLDPSVYRQHLASTLTGMPAFTPSEAEKQVRAALAAFVTKPETITFTLSPAQPFALSSAVPAYAEDPDALFRKLGFGVQVR